MNQEGGGGRKNDESKAKKRERSVREMRRGGQEKDEAEFIVRADEDRKMSSRFNHLRLRQEPQQSRPGSWRGPGGRGSDSSTGVCMYLYVRAVTADH